MNIDEIGEVLQLFEASQFDEILIEADGVRIAARRAGVPGPVTELERRPLPAALPREVPARGPGMAQQTSAPQAHPSPPSSNSVAVLAPVGGTFYRAPTPTADPFVSVGAQVRADQPVGLIEVMKLFNHVHAGVEGEIVSIACANGAIVEAGEILMHIRPHS